MDYHAFLADLANWMDASNQKVQQLTFTSDAYWDWVMQSSGELCKRYGNHPLCLEIVSALLKYQDQSLKKLN